MENFQNELVRDGLCFKRLDIGDFSISIQGHDGAYSTPRKELSGPEYTQMECATFYRNKWCVIEGYEDLYDMYRFSGKAGAGSNDVMPYVEVSKIQEIVDHLRSGNCKVAHIFEKNTLWED